MRRVTKVDDNASFYSPRIKKYVTGDVSNVASA